VEKKGESKAAFLNASKKKYGRTKKNTAWLLTVNKGSIIKRQRKSIFFENIIIQVAG